MGRSPCCEKAHTNKGAWTKEEDQRLIDYIRLHGEGSWRSLPKAAGLFRCGKSCRLRWINYLRPDLKRGNFTEEEDEVIVKLHSLLGNKWSLIAGRLPGRTDNEIKNYWNTHIKRKLLKRGIDPQTHRPLNEVANKTTSATTTTTTTEKSAVELDFRNASKASKPNFITTPSLDYKCNKFQVKAKTESVEEGNCSSSGMTTDEEQQQPKKEGINLELCIGFGSTLSESTRVTSANSAESKLQQDGFKLFGFGVCGGN
ncbi:hypothetical protein SLE2022_237440 [Rubroshorea leprosula]